MLSSTWTPDALSREARAYAGSCWRLVEAQHRVSTLKLVDSLEEQDLLEGLIEETKPSVPPECRHLDYLLSTPFRYGTAYPNGSRFRRAGRTPGVYYAAERPETAVAEMAFYRLLFFAESPETPWPRDPGEYTAFAAAIRSKRAIDLTAPPLASNRSAWTHVTDYAACQDLADASREAGVEIIRYESVRDPDRGRNVALLTCRAFEKPRPARRQTWRIRLSPSGVQAICEFPDIRIEFGRDAFAADPRIVAFSWDR
jgi:RES domain-containing protein